MSLEASERGKASVAQLCQSASRENPRHHPGDQRRELSPPRRPRPQTQPRTAARPRDDQGKHRAGPRQQPDGAPAPPRDNQRATINQRSDCRAATETGHSAAQALPGGTDKNACQAQPGHRIIAALPTAASNPIAAAVLIQIVPQQWVKSGFRLRGYCCAAAKAGKGSVMTRIKWGARVERCCPCIPLVGHGLGAQDLGTFAG